MQLQNRPCRLQGKLFGSLTLPRNRKWSPSLEQWIFTSRQPLTTSEKGMKLGKYANRMIMHRRVHDIATNRTMNMFFRFMMKLMRHSLGS